MTPFWELVYWSLLGLAIMTLAFIGLLIASVGLSVLDQFRVLIQKTGNDFTAQRRSEDQAEIDYQIMVVNLLAHYDRVSLLGAEEQAKILQLEDSQSLARSIERVTDNLQSTRRRNRLGISRGIMLNLAELLKEQVNRGIRR